MIRTKLFALMYFLGMISAIHACDICGNFMGLTPYNNRNSISLLHRYRIFNGYRDYQEHSHFFPASAYRVMHGQDTVAQRSKLYSSKDFESYKVFELRLKCFVHKRIELNAFLPVLNNKSKTNTTYEHHTGFGDISLNAGFHILLPNEEKRIKQKLVLGIGIKLPTGNYYAHNAQSDRLPFEMQPGTGSVDEFLYFNYIIIYDKVGVNINSNYKFNGTNRYHEHVSNSTTDFASVFYKLKCRSIIFYPSAQLNYEFTKGLEVKHVLQAATVVNTLLAGPGLDIYYKAFSLNASWQFTVKEKVAVGELKSAGRLSLGLSYNFNFTKD